jgi:hypothetical protein
MSEYGPSPYGSSGPPRLFDVHIYDLTGVGVVVIGFTDDPWHSLISLAVQAVEGDSELGCTLEETFVYTARRHGLLRAKPRPRHTGPESFIMLDRRRSVGPIWDRD